MAGTTEDIARFFDREACCAQSKAPSDELTRGTAALLARLEALGLDGLSVLDVGCGVGTVSIALVERGARVVTGLDLSPEAIATAERRRPPELLGRMAFAVADGATASLDVHDVVVLNKVVCCYFDPAVLLGNTAAAARRFVALSLPASVGLRGVLARLTLAAENAWRRLRGDPFRAYVHDAAALGKAVEERGFRRIWSDHLGIWRLEVYETIPD